MAITTPPPPSATETSAQPSTPSQPPPSRSRSRGPVGGLILILIGALFLAQQLGAPSWGVDVLWPVVLIILGVAIGIGPLLYGQPLHYGRAFWAVTLVAIGALFLAGNLGYLSGWDFDRLGQLWPVILVLAGVEILITRALPRQTATVLGAAVAIVAVLACALYVGLGPGISGGTVSSNASADIGNLERATLDLSVGGATVNIHTGASGGQLYSGHFQVKNGERATASLNSSTGVLRIELHNQSFLFGSSGGRTVDISLTDQIPWNISISGGASQQTLDLSSLKLSQLSISGGAEQVTLILPAATGTVPIAISGGATEITIHRPAGTEASLTMSGGANSLTADGQEQSNLAGQLNWQSTGYSGSANRYDITASGGANHLTIDMR